ncbi:MAG TPA: PhoU domain-containing protein [Terriglobales bacterium]|nr:PhoU domain-containing protein [Terriglobales bacterium]
MRRSPMARAEREDQNPRPARVHSPSELTDLVLHACLVTKDAVFNVSSLLANGSGMAVLAVKDCEYDLDRCERFIDEHIPVAITQVNEAQARQLLTCLKFITDLERIGDLMQWVAQAAQRCHPRLSKRDVSPLLQMAQALEKMLQSVHTAFVSRDAALAESVIKADKTIDEVRHTLFRKCLHQDARSNPSRVISLLLMGQAIERAGDHAKNLGEELVHLFEGRSLRHVSAGPTGRGRNLSEL